MLSVKSRYLLVGAVLVALFAGPMTAPAAILLQSKGWRITMPSWAANQSGAAIIEDNPSDPTTLVIQIVKNFRGSPDQNGLLPSIIMTFSQISPDASTVKRIIINDESVTNNTTYDWNQFSWFLTQSGYASFNKQETFPQDYSLPGQNFDTDQFADHLWDIRKNDPGDSATWVEELRLTNGIVPQGDVFSPGAAGGGLVIDLDLTTRDGSGAYGFFTLKEYPVPEPVTLGVLLVGGLLIARRRRA